MGIRKDRNTAEYYDNSKRSLAIRIVLGAVKVLLWVLAYMLIISVPQLYVMSAGYMDPSILTMVGIASIIFMCAVSYWFHRRYQKKHPENVKKLTTSDFLHNLAIFVGILLFKVAMSYLMIWIYGEDTTANDDAIFGSLDGATNFLVALNLGLSVITLAPVMEEIIFRGMISKGMFGDKHFIPAIIISSLFFSSLHLSTNVISFFLYAGIGAACFMAYWRKKNINDAILIHFLNNLPGAIILIFGLY